MRALGSSSSGRVTGSKFCAKPVFCRVRWFADAATLRELNGNRQVILRYTDGKGCIVPEANPNGSIENIAGICNRERNVFGLMPPPDRASDARLGSMDGAKIFRSMVQSISASRAARRSERVKQVA